MRSLKKFGLLARLNDVKLPPDGSSQSELAALLVRTVVARRTGAFLAAAFAGALRVVGFLVAGFLVAIFPLSYCLYYCKTLA